MLDTSIFASFAQNLQKIQGNLPSLFTFWNKMVPGRDLIFRIEIYLFECNYTIEKLFIFTENIFFYDNKCTYIIYINLLTYFTNKIFRFQFHRADDPTPPGSLRFRLL